MPPRVVVIVQARLGSTRLPGKTLADIAGRPMLDWVLDRAERIPGIDGLVLATTDRLRDDKLVDFARKQGVRCVRGSEQDVLDRFHVAVTEHPADVIVRVTPDCPLLDPEVAGQVLAKFLQTPGRYDYVSNVHPPTFPDGLDTEVFSRDALETAWREAELPSDREHVTPFMWRRAGPERFRLGNVTGARDLSTERWTVDTATDLDFVRKIYEILGPSRPIFGMEEVLDLLHTHPELRDINAGQRRNEGYQRSLAADAAAPRTSR